MPTSCPASAALMALFSLGGLETVAPEHVAVDLHLQLRRPAFGFELDLRRAGRLFQNAFDLFRAIFQHVVVVAENLHRQFRFRAFEHFVEAHLDGLREEDAVVRVDFLEHRLDLLAQLRLVHRPARRFRPLVERFVEDVNVALVRRHRVGGDFAGADAGEDAGDLRKFLQQPILDFDVGPERFLHAHAHGFVEHRGDGTLVELGHELRAEAGEQPE